jgi:hypothetical protein
LDVAAAVGTGIILPSGRTGVSCDVNSSSDNTIPAESFTDADGADPLELSPSGVGLGFDDSAPTGDTGNTNDGLDVPAFQMQASPFSATPPAGSFIAPAVGPCGASGVALVDWYENGVLVSTIDYTQDPPVYTTPGGPTNSVTFWQGSDLGQYAIVLQVGDGPLITSVVTCNNGIQVASSVTVGSGVISRDYTWQYLQFGNWVDGSYISKIYPPYLGDGPSNTRVVYCYDPAFGGWFFGAAGPPEYIDAVRITSVT